MPDRPAIRAAYRRLLVPRPRNDLQTVQRILDEIGAATTLDDLLERTTDVLHRTFGNLATCVLQIAPDGRMIVTRAMRAVAPPRGDMFITIDAGVIGAAARSGRTVLANDTSADPRHVPMPGWETRAELSVPVITSRGMWGVIDMQSARRGAFTPRRVRLVEIVARQFAIAVENASLIDQARDQALLLARRARELTQVLALNSRLRVGSDLTELLTQIAEAIREVMGYRVVVVNLVDAAANRAWVAAIAGATPAEHAALDGATYRWDTFFGGDPARFRVSESYFIPAEAGVDPEGPSARPPLDIRAPGEWQVDDMLLIPIVNQRGETLGVISVDDPYDRRRPGLATIQSLEIFAAQVAAAIENARLYGQMQQALEETRQAQEQQARLLDEVRRTQAELITASRLAAVGTLAAGVAHEFNNLLATMYGFAELGLSGDGAAKDEALQVVQRASRRGQDITRQLLTFARHEPGYREPTKLTDVAEGALKLIHWDLARLGITIQRDYLSDAWVMADAGQLMQVVLNLLTNARDAMVGAGGTLTIATRDTEQWAELAVGDTGCGIPPELLGKIFEPFVTTKGALGGGTLGGTGLGLSVSYGIVQGHRGQLLVESEVGRGSRFIVRLPRGETASG